MRQLATIQRVADLQPIEGADKIEKARIKDWWVVVQKGLYKIGDLVVYFEIDSFLPDLPMYAFLKKGSTLKRMTIESEIRVGIRLKTIKLRGQISQGLLMPLSEYYAQPDTDHGYFSETMPIEAGMDVSKTLNIIKYEPPIPADLAGKMKGFFPSFIPKTDEERIQNMGDILTNYYITEKLDGTSVTYFKKDGVFGVCSRNLELLDTEGNTQWRIAKELNLIDKLPDNCAIQGELVGEGIQGNPLKITGQKIYFYNVYKIMENATYPDDGEYLDFENFKTFITGLGLETVPVLDENFSLPKTVESFLEFAKGNSIINPASPREGIVVRPKIEMTYKGQRLSFKVISNDYLLNE